MSGVPETFEGAQELYGTVIMVGGQPDPVVHLDTNWGVLVCPTTREIAQKLAMKLYKPVRVGGVATRSYTTFRVEAFSVFAVLPYDPLPIDEAFARLREIVGDAFDHITDVNAWVAEMRGYDLEKEEA